MSCNYPQAVIKFNGLLLPIEEVVSPLLTAPRELFNVLAKQEFDRSRPTEHVLRRTLASCKYLKKCTHEEKARGPSGACVTSLNYPDYCRVQPLARSFRSGREQKANEPKPSRAGADRYLSGHVGAPMRTLLLLKIFAYTL